MRTVIWTDVFQFIVLYGGLLVILVMVSILNYQDDSKIFSCSYIHPKYIITTMLTVKKMIGEQLN